MVNSRSFLSSLCTYWSCVQDLVCKLFASCASRRIHSHAGISNLTMHRRVDADASASKCCCKWRTQQQGYGGENRSHPLLGFYYESFFCSINENKNEKERTEWLKI